MKEIIFFEIRKILKAKKNIVFLACLLLIILVIVLKFNNYNNKSLVLEKDQCSSEIEILAGDKSKTQLMNLYKKKLDAFENKTWRERLQAQIELDKYLLENNINEYESLDIVSDRIQKNKELLKDGIEPINEYYDMSSYNFLVIFGKNIFPVFFIVLIFLISSDIVSSERQEGTFKFMLIQPYSREKIMVSKIIAAAAITIAALLLILLFGFFILGAVNGFGNPLYPMKFYDLASKSYKFIGIKKFDFALTGMNFILVLFLTSLGVLISNVFKDSLSSVSFALILDVMIFMINIRSIITYKLMYLNPFSYISSFNILSGTFINCTSRLNIKYFFIVIISCTIFNFILSIVLFSKKDIT
ncbi:MAG: ABC transporter permease subunit [Clostridiaceae bacterium]